MNGQLMQPVKHYIAIGLEVYFHLSIQSPALLLSCSFQEQFEQQLSGKV